MKTTLDLSDALFMQAKELAHTKGLTLKSMVEDGLRHVLAKLQDKPEKPFVLQDRRFLGGNPSSDIDFSQLREMANERPNTTGAAW